MPFLTKSKDEQLWLDNCGRGVHYHCSWLPLLQRFKMLGKWSSGPGQLKLAAGGKGVH